jgi:hypothetical protein
VRGEGSGSAGYVAAQAEGRQLRGWQSGGGGGEGSGGGAAATAAGAAATLSVLGEQPPCYDMTVCAREAQRACSVHAQAGVALPVAAAQCARALARAQVARAPASAASILPWSAALAAL